MLIQNKRFFEIENDEIKKAVFSPRKDAFIWYGLRLVVTLIGFVGIIILTKFTNESRMLEILLISLGGFLAVKIAFIIYLLIFNERR